MSISQDEAVRVTARACNKITHNDFKCRVMLRRLSPVSCTNNDLSSIPITRQQLPSTDVFDNQRQLQVSLERIAIGQDSLCSSTTEPLPFVLHHNCELRPVLKRLSRLNTSVGETQEQSHDCELRTLMTGSSANRAVVLLNKLEVDQFMDAGSSPDRTELSDQLTTDSCTNIPQNISSAFVDSSTRQCPSAQLPLEASPFNEELSVATNIQSSPICNNDAGINSDSYRSSISSNSSAFADQSYTDAWDAMMINWTDDSWQFPCFPQSVEVSQQFPDEQMDTDFATELEEIFRDEEQDAIDDVNTANDGRTINLALQSPTQFVNDFAIVVNRVDPYDFLPVVHGG